MIFMVMMIASDDNLLRMYNLVLPALTLTLVSFVATQRFLDSPCFAQNVCWSQLVSYLSGIMEYFGDKDQTWSCQWFHGERCVVLLTQLVLLTILLKVITLNSSKKERITLTAAS